MRAILPAVLTAATLVGGGCQSQDGQTRQPAAVADDMKASAGFTIARTYGTPTGLKTFTPYYLSHAELVARLTKRAAERHMDPDLSAITDGGHIECLVYALDVKQLDYLEVIALRDGKAIGRAKLSPRQASLDRIDNVLYFWGGVVINLDTPPSARSPVSIECLGIEGKSDAFLVSASSE